MHWPTDWKQWSEFGQAAALFGGVAFVLLKAVFGYFMINLTIDPSVQRSRGRNRKVDDLLLTIKLTKGDREAASVSTIRITLVEVAGANELSAFTAQEHALRNPERDRSLKLSPGETAVFSYHFEAPTEAVYKFKIELIGGSGFFGWPRCYWVVSVVSLPRPEARES